MQHAQHRAQHRAHAQNYVRNRKFTSTSAINIVSSLPLIGSGKQLFGEMLLSKVKTKTQCKKGQMPKFKILPFSWLSGGRHLSYDRRSQVDSVPTASNQPHYM